MRRGRPVTKGIDDAIAIAQKRGCVMRVTYALDSVCDFFIRTVMHVTFVRVVRFEKIVAPVNEIRYECREVIAGLRLFPPSQQIRLEVWIYSRHGTYRFFRLVDTGLEEIQQSGELKSAAPDESPARVAVVLSTPKVGVAGGADTPT